MEQELTQLIILPLAEKGKENKQKRVEQVIELAKQIEDEDDQTFVLTGLLVSSDKFIDRECAENIRRRLSMTKVFRVIEESGIEKGVRKTAENMLKMDMDIEIIIKATGLTKEEIEEIQKELHLTV